MTVLTEMLYLRWIQYINMFDLGKEKISINCPQCGGHHTVTLNKVTSNESIYCPCGTTIHLQDKDGSVNNSTRSINNDFRDLENTMRNLGR